jgi:hypothetical protein
MVAIVPPLVMILIVTLVFYLAKWNVYKRK